VNKREGRISGLTGKGTRRERRGENGGRILKCWVFGNRVPWKSLRGWEKSGRERNFCGMPSFRGSSSGGEGGREGGMIRGIKWEGVKMLTEVCLCNIRGILQGKGSIRGNVREYGLFMGNGGSHITHFCELKCKREKGEGK